MWYHKLKKQGPKRLCAVGLPVFLGGSHLTGLVKKPLPGAAKAFLSAFALACAIFVPICIFSNGCFLYMGDYNVQQIAFYKLAHGAVRSGNVFWNWQTDLGANFIGSYSFYLLFSPFFWLTLPFPNAWVPYLMAPLLILKTACAALTGYLYIRRFVRTTNGAVLGSILYAFSGFMLFNVFFNHFHEACVFFPLLLVALEELVENDRRGLFAVAVAINAVVNYWFFIGEVMFVLFYVAVRIATGGWNCTFEKFCMIALESVIGLLLACAAFLPSVMAIMGNPRTGLEKLLNGQLMWIWGWNQRLPAIIESFFFPPEIPSAPTFFPKMGAKWSSLSAWLPLFSSCGVIAFCRAEKKNFHKRMIVLSLILSLVPIFNSVFVLFNDSYYARWFYMPILMMCVATASALEKRNEPLYRETWKSGLRWVTGFVAVFVLAVGFSPVLGADGEVTFGLYDDAARFAFLSVTAVVCLALTWMLLFALSDKACFRRVTAGLLSFVIVGYSIGYIASGKHDRKYDLWYLDVVVKGADRITVETDEPFARSDFYECVDNLGMQWGLPNIQCFHSVVPVSVMEFYTSLGITRDVSSKPPVSYRELRDLLSVRWLFIKEDENEQEPMRGFDYVDFQNGYYIYENENWLPMGFAYDTAIYAQDLEAYSGEMKVRYLLHALALDEDTIDRNEDILTLEGAADEMYLSASHYDDVIKERRDLAVDSFSIDRRGFSAESSYDRERMVLFSVPYDDGWTCTVNGESARIEKVDYGLMAVRVPAGEASIRFDYLAPGLKTGCLLSGAGALLLLLWLAVSKKRRTAAPLPDVPEETEGKQPQPADLPSENEGPAAGEETP